MSETSFSAGMSLLDEAHAKRLQGDRDGALKLAIAILEAAPVQLGAASLLATLLTEADRPFVASEATSRLVDAFIRRGDLAAASVAAHTADCAGEDGRTLRAQIAEAFGKGSSRLADVSPAPPPLPQQAEVAPILDRLHGAALLDRAEEALQKFLGEDDPMPAEAQVPELPLFSALEPAPLTRLLESLQVKEVDTGHRLIVQEDEGTEAYVLVRGVMKVVRESAERTTLAALGPGSIFGEMALVSDAPRAASVEAVEPALLLAVSRAELEMLAAEQPAIGEQLGRFCRSRMIANLIRHSAILGSVEPAQRTTLIERFRTRSFESGQALVRQGQETSGLFLIASGRVEVQGQDAEGDQVKLAELGPGDVVGEISLVLRRPATADVTAVHPTIALQLPREEFQQAIREYPGLLNELYETATKREEETRSVVAQEALDVEDVVLV